VRPRESINPVLGSIDCGVEGYGGTTCSRHGPGWPRRRVVVLQRTG